MLKVESWKLKAGLGTRGTPGLAALGPGPFSSDAGRRTSELDSMWRAPTGEGRVGEGRVGELAIDPLESLEPDAVVLGEVRIDRSPRLFVHVGPAREHGP